MPSDMLNFRAFWCFQQKQHNLFVQNYLMKGNIISNSNMHNEVKKIDNINYTLCTKQWHRYRVHTDVGEEEEEKIQKRC